MRFPIKNTKIFTQSLMILAECVKIENINRRALVVYGFRTLGERAQSGVKFGFVITKINQPKL